MTQGTLLWFQNYKCTVLFVPDRSIRAQQASSSHQCEYGRAENVCIYSCCAVLCVILAVMCICVIYKFLSLGL
jgi:hypothetical protein